MKGLFEGPREPMESGPGSGVSPAVGSQLARPDDALREGAQLVAERGEAGPDEGQDGPRRKGGSLSRDRQVVLERADADDEVGRGPI